MDLQDYNLYTFFRIYVWSIDQDGARGCRDSNKDLKKIRTKKETLR